MPSTANPVLSRTRKLPGRATTIARDGTIRLARGYMKAEAVKTPRSEPQRKSDPLPPANRTARTPQRDSCRKKGDAASANPKVSLPSCDRGLFDLEDVQVELATNLIKRMHTEVIKWRLHKGLVEVVWNKGLPTGAFYLPASFVGDDEVFDTRFVREAHPSATYSEGLACRAVQPCNESLPLLVIARRKQSKDQPRISHASRPSPQYINGRSPHPFLSGSRPRVFKRPLNSQQRRMTTQPTEK